MKIHFLEQISVRAVMETRLEIRRLEDTDRTSETQSNWQPIRLAELFCTLQAGLVVNAHDMSPKT